VITGQAAAGREQRERPPAAHFDYADFEPAHGTHLRAHRGSPDRIAARDLASRYMEAGKGGGHLQESAILLFAVISTDQTARRRLRLSDGLPVPTSPNLNNERNSRAAIRTLGFRLEVDESHAVELRHPARAAARSAARRVLRRVADQRLNFSYNFNQSYPGPGAQGPRRPLFPVNQAGDQRHLRNNYGSAKFHSLQSRLQKRYSRGLTVSAAFTYAKYLSNSPTSTAAATVHRRTPLLPVRMGSHARDRRVAVVTITPTSCLSAWAANS